VLERLKRKELQGRTLPARMGRREILDQKWKRGKTGLLPMACPEKKRTAEEGEQMTVKRRKKQ